MASSKPTPYHWLTVATGLVMLTVVNGIINSSISAFDKTLLQEFGWTRAELKFRESVTSGVAIFLLILSGILIDRIGSKKMILIGTTLLAIGLACYTQIQNKYQMYAVHIILAMSLVSAGTTAVVVLASSWYKSNRGIVLGIMLMGTSLGGVVFPKFIKASIEANGWRETMMLMIVLPICLFVWTLFFVKNRPQERGLQPVGEAVGQPVEDLLQSGLSYKEATRTAMFWLIGISGFFTFYSILSLISHTFLLMQDLGYDANVATNALVFLAFMSISGKFLFSSLTNYFNLSPYRIFAICCTGMFLGSLGYCFVTKDTIWFAIPTMTICWGGVYTLYNLIIVRSFGLKSAGKINSTISIMESAGAALGPWLTGYLHDKTHSYQAAFGLVSVLLLCCAILSYRFQKYAIA